MIKFIFSATANFLLFVARKTKLSYNEINVLVYFFIIPFSWLVLLDYIFDFHYLKVCFALFCLGFAFGCRNFESFSDWLFGQSVRFLNYFNRFGSNYEASSVWICVSIPILVYEILAMLALNK